MQCLPKSTHLWSDSHSVPPGCCSGAALLLSFPWYVPGFRKITARAADGRLSGITSWQALALCFQMLPVFQREIYGSSATAWITVWLEIIQFIFNFWLERKPCHSSLFPFEMKRKCCTTWLKKIHTTKKDEEPKTTFTIFNFILKAFPWGLKVKIAKWLENVLFYSDVQNFFFMFCKVTHLSQSTLKSNKIK